MNKKNTLIALFFFCYLMSNAQIYQIWASRYNGANNLVDSASVMALDNNGNIFVAGSVAQNSIDKDIIVIKYDSKGDTLWTRTTGGIRKQEDIVTAMVTDGLGNVYITGEVDSNYVTLGYNSNGNLLWSKTYSGAGNNLDHPVAIAVDANNNVYITGYSDNAIATDTNFDYVTIKYNSTGVQQWLATYDGPGKKNDRASALAVDANGNVYVTGYAYSTLGNRDYMTIKYDNNGVLQWATPYARNLGGYSKPVGIVVNSSSIWVTGRASNGKDYDYVTVKYNLSGAQQWASVYDGGDRDFARAVGVDNFGNSYVAGSRRVAGGTNDDCLIVKYDANGVQQWIAAYNGPANLDDDARKMIVLSNGDVYVGGESNTVASLSDYVLIKYNTLGTQQWVKTYNGTANSYDGIRAMGRNNAGDIFVTGYSEGTGSSKDIVTIKYSTSPTSVENLNTENTDIKIFPLPAEDKTTLYLSSNILGSGNKITFKLYDLMGNEVKVLENINSTHTEINKDNLSSGIYFYSILVNDTNGIYNGRIIFN